MTASERLMALDRAMTPGPWGAAYWPTPEPHYWIGQHDPDIFSSKMLGVVAGAPMKEADANGLVALRDALPLIADVVVAAEAECSPKENSRDKDAAYWAAQPDHPIPGVQRRIDLARALTALREHLEGGDVT